MRSKGRFWLPYLGLPEEESVRGVLKHSSRETRLKLYVRDRSQVASFYRAGADGFVFGELDIGSFVRVEGCYSVGESNSPWLDQVCKNGPKYVVVTLKSRGAVLIGSKEILECAKITAHESHAILERLSDWFSTPPTVSSSANSSKHQPCILRSSPSKIIEMKCGGRDLNMKLKSGHELKLQSILRQTSGSRYALSLEQVTVAKVTSKSLEECESLAGEIIPLVSLVKFLSGTDCRILEMSFLKRGKDSSFPFESHLLIRKRKDSRVDNLTSQILCKADISGRENSVIQKWYNLYEDEEKKHAIDMLNLAIDHPEYLLSSIVSMAGVIENLERAKKRKSREKLSKIYCAFFTNLGATSEHLSTEKIAKKIAGFRGNYAHGKPAMSPNSRETLEISRLLFGAVKIFLMKEIGLCKNLSLEQVGSSTGSRVILP